MSEFESHTAALRNNPGLLPVRNTQIGRATGFFLRPAGPPCCVFPGLLRCGVASPAAAAGCQRCRQGALPCYSRAWRRHQQRACVRQPQEHLAACTCGVVHAVPPCSCSLEYAERQRISAAQDTTSRPLFKRMVKAPSRSCRIVCTNVARETIEDPSTAPVDVLEQPAAAMLLAAAASCSGIRALSFSHSQIFRSSAACADTPGTSRFTPFGVYQ